MEQMPPKEESHETRLRRLRMRSWRRGMKEMDLILGKFADTQMASLSAEALDSHEHLMNQPDQEIYSWITGAAPTPDEFSPAIARILANLSVRSS